MFPGSILSYFNFNVFAVKSINEIYFVMSGFSWVVEVELVENNWLLTIRASLYVLSGPLYSNNFVCIIPLALIDLDSNDRILLLLLLKLPHHYIKCLAINNGCRILS